MTTDGCARLAELRSAYLDGALGDEDRERVLAHLVDCDSCRAEISELQAVRRLLQGMATSEPGTSSSPQLSSRLVSIAGRDARVPVWSRPFRRTRSGSLPRSRRSRRVRTTAAALAVGGLVSTWGVIGLAAAPSSELVAVADPTDRVRSEFAATLTQFPLTSRSVNAVLVTPAADLLNQGLAQSMISTRSPESPSPTAAGRRLPRSAVVRALQRAADENDRVSFTGTQTVTAVNDGQTISAQVEIHSQAGQGSSVQIVDSQGSSVVDGFVPTTTSSRMADDQLLSLLLKNYTISGWTGSTVAGRAATLVQATNAEDASGPPAARWWIDNATGLLLWQETYDDAGDVLLAAGFTDLDLDSRGSFMEHLAPRLAVSTTTASLTLSNAPGLTSRGWTCQTELAGLSLVRLRSDEAQDPDALHLVYSDGVSTLSVFEQRGVLSGPPRDSRWDEGLRAYVRSDTPNMATWSSGDTVFTVVSDGSVDLVRSAVSALPHHVSAAPTTMERIRAGWVRIIELVIG